MYTFQSGIKSAVLNVKYRISTDGQVLYLFLAAKKNYEGNFSFSVLYALRYRDRLENAVQSVSKKVNYG